MNRIAARRIMLASALAVVIGLVTIEFFLSDLGMDNLKAWGAAALVATGVTVCALAFPRGSMARALLWFVALPIAGFLLVYDLIDAALDPYLSADWPIAVVAFLFVTGVELIVLAAQAEDD